MRHAHRTIPHQRYASSHSGQSLWLLVCADVHASIIHNRSLVSKCIGLLMPILRSDKYPCFDTYRTFLAEAKIRDSEMDEEYWVHARGRRYRTN
ncbi:hypothetical protein ARMSODRAFT_386602 [Armillaria solidipes]|uniref:Uncharacterized protein n=1 Tax=Armillaria solidipes TaxID=1076256 RepID=A0A2H3BWZ5_9AGAR|nr:hypothetical protein ARMSODRAFT_386602 [Armillaria solidipes]